jgi:hypothetical protein
MVMAALFAHYTAAHVATRTVHLRRFSQSAISDHEQTIERDFREAARLARVLGESFRDPTIPGYRATQP